MNDHLHPVFAGILNAAAARTDATPAGAVPVPRELPKPAYGSNAKFAEFGLYQCCWCQGGHSREDHRGLPRLYCSDACEMSEDGGR